MGDVSYVVGENLPRRACCFLGWMRKEQIGLTVGPRKLASVGITGKLTIAMKDRHQFWVQIHEGCHAVFSALTPTFGIWP